MECLFLLVLLFVLFLSEKLTPYDGSVGWLDACFHCMSGEQQRLFVASDQGRRER